MQRKQAAVSTLVALLLLCCTSLPAQSSCSGDTLAGVVEDGTGAILPGATLTLDSGTPITANADGSFRIPCVASGPHQLQVTDEGFAPRSVPIESPYRGQLHIQLQVATVETTVAVSETPQPAQAGAAGSPESRTITKDQLSTYADDPDDLLRELQQLAATTGSSPSKTIITVDGFQNNVQLPPKSSIAYIKVNPDLYSAEYRQPPLEGGRVEVYTKPGQSTFHGALFTTNGSSWMNAQNPFSTSKGALGKQLYGMELSGPVRKQGSDFALSLEHRTIDDTAVVNAITLDSMGNHVSTVSSVPIPQALWLATARVGWQLGERNTFTAAYSADTNQLENLGVGGTSLAENGYNSNTYEHTLRLSNITVASAKLMHEARVSLDWTGTDDTPLSTAPQVQVSGAFTGGGATVGPEHDRKLVLEIDDDAVINAGSHLIKAGVQFRNATLNSRLPTTFNGSYTFGGGTAPVLDGSGQPIAGQSETISGVEQYRRALLGLAGGVPTAFVNVAGDAAIHFYQTRTALYLQDEWKLRSNLEIAMGVRYYLQNDPAVYDGATPRLGFAWNPDKQKKWQLHGHLGLFTGQYSVGEYQELLREDGTHRVTSTVYNPVYGNPLSDSTQVVHSVRTASPHLANVSISIENAGATRSLPHGWALSLDCFAARIWNYARSVNVNSPLNGSATGPRPGAANLDIFQVNNSGQGGADLQVLTVSQQSSKHVQFSAGATRVNLKDDTDDDTFFSPQSSATDAGEFAHRTGQPIWQIYGDGILHAPVKIDLSTNLHVNSGAPYNITTGFDNNGDGNFNDRPQYATAGATNAYATPFGNLVASGGAGVFPRNAGRAPWTVYMDANVQRTFALSRSGKADHPQVLVVNLRSSNLLNHTNVTAIGGVLGSPLFGVPYGADNSRRVEGGLRYSF